MSSDTDTWLDLAYSITHSQEHNTFQAHFGISPEMCVSLWNSIATKKNLEKFTALHLLWTLYFLKTTPSSLAVACGHLQCDENTLLKWLPVGLNLIINSLPQ